MNVDIIPAVQIRPQFQHVSTGDARILRNYRSRISVAGGLKINLSSEAGLGAKFWLRADIHRDRTLIPE